MNPNLYKLFKIQCMDLLCLLDMESNGIYFNTDKAMTHAKELEGTLNKLLTRFYLLVGSNSVKITSNYDLSSVLYGGVIEEPIRIPVGFYKTGAKAGEVRYKIETIVHTFPRIVEPLPKTETKESFKRLEKGITEVHTQWEVNEPVLRSLKAKGVAKEVIEIILEYSKIEKLRGTYLEGYTKLIEEMGWNKNYLHGAFNQCVAVTGRLSSTKPNLQNADKKTKLFMESRYN